MRTSFRLLCAAGDAPATAAAGAAAAKETPLTWRTVPRRAWFKSSGKGHMFAGDKLGPNPLLVLSGFGNVDRFLPMLKATDNVHGTLHAPLPSLTGDTAPQFLQDAATAVVTVLDDHNITWANVLAHSVGASVAVQAAWMYPERIGALALLDTPLLTAQMASYYAAHEEAQQAMKSPNIPLLEIEFHTAELEDEALHVADAADTEAYAKLVNTMAEGAPHTQRYANYIEPPYITRQLLRHPTLLLTPKDATQSVMERTAGTIAAHKQWLNIRKHQTVKSAADHAGLLEAGAAAEVGGAIKAFFERYNTDAVIAKKWDKQFKPELLKAKEGAGGGAPDAGQDDKANKKKKKDKKKDKG